MYWLHLIIFFSLPKIKIRTITQELDDGKSGRKPQSVESKH